MATPAVVKYLWAAPASLIGLVAAALAVPFGARSAVHEGVIEVTLSPRAYARRSRRIKLPFAAITLGHVVIAGSQSDHTRLRAHERVHVNQYERWGLLFLLAYPAESLMQLLLGRRPYLDNRFELQAQRSGSEPPPTANRSEA